MENKTLNTTMMSAIAIMAAQSEAVQRAPIITDVNPYMNPKFKARCPKLQKHCRFMSPSHRTSGMDMHA